MAEKDILGLVSEVVQKLASDSKPDRRSAIKEVQKVIDNHVESHSDVVGLLLEPLVKVISADEVGSLRENAANCLLKLIQHLTVTTAEPFETVVKLLVERCSQEELEEVRLKLAQVFHSLIKVQSNQEVYLKHLDDMTKILKAQLSDRFAEVIKESCDSVLQLADANKHFRLQADFLVQPLIQNLKTQPLKVKVTCVKALHPILASSPLTIPEVTPQLEKCWTDNSPHLRLAIVQSVGRTALEIESDDQNYHRLIPFLLLGTCNDFVEVSEEARTLWKKVQHQLDEPDSSADQWFTKLLPDLLKGAEDWNNDIRIQTAQLFFCFLQETSDKKIELATVMEILAFQVADEESPVRHWALKSAHLLGESCPEEAMKWLLPRSADSYPDMLFFSQILQGSLSKSSCHPADALNLSIDLLLKFILAKDWGSSGSCLLDGMESLLQTEARIDTERMDQLLLVTVLLEEAGDQESSRKQRLLERTAARMGFSSVKNMFQQRLPTLWTSWGMEAPEKWTGTSCSSWRLLQYIARDLKLVDGYVFGLLCQTISSTQVPEIKLKCLNILTASMDHLIADECDPATLRSLLQSELKWRSGRSAAVLRSSASLCTYSALQFGRLMIDTDNVNAYVDSFLPLVEDEVAQTRLAAARVLKRCLMLAGPSSLAKVDSVLSTLLGRLNDVSKDVRHEVMTGMRDVFLHWRQRQDTPTDETHRRFEKKFLELVRVLTRDDDDPPSQTLARSVLQSMEHQSNTPATELLEKLSIGTTKDSPTGIAS